MESAQQRLGASLEQGLGKVLDAVLQMEAGSLSFDARDVAASLGVISQSLEARGRGALVLLVEEIASTVQAVERDGAAPRQETCRVLRAGLAELTRGVAPSPLVVLNDLRALRSAPLLTESPLFDTGADVGLPAPPPGSPWTDTELRGLGRGLRPYYQKGLVSWLRGEDRAGSLELMQVVLERLADVGAGRPGGVLWWVALGLVDALSVGALAAGPALRRQFGQLDRELKRLAEEGEAALRIGPAPGLLCNLLFYLECAGPCAPRPRRIGGTFGLGACFDVSALSAEQRERATDEVRGVLHAVAQLLDADPLDASATPVAVSPTLDRACDTLALLGLIVQRRLVLSLNARMRVSEGLTDDQARAIAARLRDALDVAVGPGHEQAFVDLASRARRRSGEVLPRRLQHELRHLREAMGRIERQRAPEAVATPSAEADPLEVRMEPGSPRHDSGEPRMLDFAALAERVDGLSSETMEHWPEPETPLPSDVGLAAPSGAADGDGDPLQRLQEDGVALDSTLLENLSTVAGALDEVRERAEGRVGGVRDGLENMGDTLRELKSYLRRVELVAEAHAPSASPRDHIAGSPLPELALADLGGRLHQLSSRIDSLQNMQDAVSSLAGEAQSLLTRQAREHVDLRQELARAPGAADATTVVEGSAEVLVVRIDEQRFALPLEQVMSVSRLPAPRSAYRTGGSFAHGGLDCELHYLGELLDIPAGRDRDLDAVVVLAGEATSMALLVDELCGRQRVRTVDLGPQLTGAELVRAAGLNADDPPILILEPAELVRASRAGEIAP